MKLLNIITSNAIRFFRFGTPSKGAVYGVTLARAFEDRYGFVQGPRTVEQFDMSKGVAFLHGQFERRALIDKCTLFTDGMIVETRTGTEEADKFIDDAIEWVVKTMSDPPPEFTDLGRAYVSKLEISMDASIGKAVDRFNEFGRDISATITQYGNPTPPLEFASLALNCDITKIVGRAPGPFLFERRAEKSYEENVYFSSASLKTLDHLVYLERMEKMLRA